MSSRPIAEAERSAAQPDARAERTSALPFNLSFAAEVEALNRVRTKHLRLPPALMQMYEERTWRNRRSVLVSWFLVIAAVNAICLAFEPFIVPADAVALYVYSRAGVTAMLIAAALVIHRQTQPGPEGVIVIAVCLTMVVVAGICGMLSDSALIERYVVQAIIAGGTAILVARIRMTHTIVLAVSLMAAVSAFFFLSSALSLAEKLQLSVFYSCGIAGLVSGRDAQNRIHYRLFVLGLNERIKMFEISEVNERLAAMARTDTLTTVSNRRHFEEVFAALSAGDRADATAVGLFMIDIDNFKPLNDALGHEKGDQCLRRVASTIREGLRSQGDFVARYGGEEFVVLLPGTHPGEAHRAAERLRAAVEALEMPNPGAPNGRVTISIGVSVAPPIETSALVQRADEALYEAKQLGRNRVQMHGLVGVKSAAMRA